MNIINIILILLLIDTLFRILLKPKLDRFSCGIFAWAGRTPKSFDRSKFNVLGILNETRGKDSCGVAVDGEIFHGLDGNKEFRNFIVNKSYPQPNTVPIVIGHTRASTFGAHTLENAHPFGFGESKKVCKGNFAFTGVHNGTIYNYEDLAEMFKIEPKGTRISNNIEIPRDKIDSEILLEAIYKNKNYKILSQYNGAVAIIFTHVDEPEYIYCFHGASVKSILGKDQTNFIERPLFAYQEHKNSLYISSQKHGLQAIGGTDDTIFEFKTNKVYKIKNGNLASAEITTVSRIGQQHERIYQFEKKKISKEAERQMACAYNLKDYGEGGHNATAEPFRPKNNNPLFHTFNIYKDVQVGPKSKKVYMEQLRYKRNGHPLDGIFVWIPNYGFHFVGGELKGAEMQFWYLVDKKFFNNEFIFDEKTLSTEDDFIIPFPSTLTIKGGKIGFKKEITDPLHHFFFMYEGIRIKNYKDYAAAMNFRKNKNSFSTMALSNIACHPIIDLKYSYRPDESQGILFDGVLADGNFCPLGSEKIYYIFKGNNKQTELVDTAKHRVPFSNLDLVINELVTNEDDIMGKENNEPKRKKEKLQVVHSLSQVEQLFNNNDNLFSAGLDPVILPETDDEFNDLLDLLDELFLPIISKFQQSRVDLKKFKDTERGKKALKIINTFLKDTAGIVAVELEN